jgi:hypothetical protein
LDFDPTASMSAERFPPPVVEFYNQVKSQPRFVQKIWSFESNQGGFSATFMGAPVEVKEEGSRYSVVLPIDHAILGQEVVVLKKENFGPLIYPLEKLPPSVRFVTVEDRRRPTKGLFAPLEEQTPPVELKWFFSQWELNVLFLGSAARNEEGVWTLKGQWLENATSRMSPVITSIRPNLSEAVTQLMDDLSTYLSPDGTVLEKPTSSISAFEKVTPSKPFYETWWFWTLAGVGLVGAGVGGYFLLKPDDSLQLSIQGPSQ